MMPRVALTTTIDPRGGDADEPRVAVYAKYLEALQRVGLIPVLVTPAHDREVIDRLVDDCHGLVLSGGDDIDPMRYDEEPSPRLGPVNPARDAAELHTLHKAVLLDLPILGICRGHQLLNVHFGGTLHQDIDPGKQGGVVHRQTSGQDVHRHEVTVEQASRLGRAIGTGRIEINSYHHQAIKDVAPNLDVTARADDGLIEAVESRDHDWIVGVQWHPERHEATCSDRDPNIRLFRAFADVVGERAG